MLKGVPGMLDYEVTMVMYTPHNSLVACSIPNTYVDHLYITVMMFCTYLC